MSAAGMTHDEARLAEAREILARPTDPGFTSRHRTATLILAAGRAALAEVDALDAAVIRFANAMSDAGMPWVCHSDELAAVKRAFARAAARAEQ